MKIYDRVTDLKESGASFSLIDRDFPHIAKLLNMYWGSAECIKYIDELLNFVPTKERPSRNGFPFEVLLELNVIYEYHCREYPSSCQPKDVWGGFI